MAGGRSGGSGLFWGLVPAAILGKAFVSKTVEQAETNHYLNNGGYNIERQKELERWARSRDPVEHRKFEEVYGRPLYRDHDDWSYHDAIYYISFQEKWRYCESEDYTGNQRPVWFNGSKSEWATKRNLLRADKYVKLMPRLKQYFEWYNNYKDGTPFYTGVFPEEYETEEGYRRALERKYPNLHKNIEVEQRYAVAEEKAQKGVDINQVAIELCEKLSETENYDEYINILWRHFINESPTKNQLAAKVYAWILLHYRSISEKRGLLKALQDRLADERLKDIDTVYKKLVSERVMYFRKYDAFKKDDSCAIGIDCMDLAWQYNTNGEKETLELIKKKLTKIIGDKYVRGIMCTRFENKEFPQFSPIEIHKIF